MRLVVFGYDFPHWKTVNGLLALKSAGYDVLAVLAPSKKLNIPCSDYRVSPIEFNLNPKDVCIALGIGYLVKPHEEYDLNFELGVVLGARILPKKVIDRFSKGIINIHPGILPGNRGLDNLKHSIIKVLPIGNTAHLIDHRIDMGTILKTQITEIKSDDTIRDIFIRQRSEQIKLLLEVLQTDLTGVPCEPSEKFTAITKEEDDNLHLYWEEYKCGLE